MSRAYYFFILENNERQSDQSADSNYEDDCFLNQTIKVAGSVQKKNSYELKALTMPTFPKKKFSRIYQSYLYGFWINPQQSSEQLFVRRA